MQQWIDICIFSQFSLVRMTMKFLVLFKHGITLLYVLNYTICPTWEKSLGHGPKLSLFSLVVDDYSGVQFCIQNLSELFNMMLIWGSPRILQNLSILLNSYVSKTYRSPICFISKCWNKNAFVEYYKSRPFLAWCQLQIELKYKHTPTHFDIYMILK